MTDELDGEDIDESPMVAELRAEPEVARSSSQEEQEAARARDRMLAIIEIAHFSNKNISCSDGWQTSVAPLASHRLTPRRSAKSAEPRLRNHNRGTADLTPLLTAEASDATETCYGDVADHRVVSPISNPSEKM